MNADGGEDLMRRQAVTKKNDKIFVSVIIPTFNAKKRLSLLLESLEKQSVKNFEVIVVDDGSTDGTKRVVAEWMKRFPVPLRYYYLNHTDIFGAGIARNYGSKHAQGRIFLFLDQDCVARRDLIERHIDHQKTNDVILGYYAGYTDDGRHYDLSRLHGYVRQKNQLSLIKEFRDALFCNAPKDAVWKCFLSAHFSIKKKIFKRIHFDESFVQWGCEDIDLGYRLFCEKVNIGFVKECIVYNSSIEPRRAKAKFLTLVQSLIQMYNKYQTKELRHYCFERFYHTPLKYRGSWQLIFKKNNFMMRESRTKIVIGRSGHAVVVAGPDFVDAEGTIASMIPMITSIHFDITTIKNMDEAALLDFRSSFHRLTKRLRDKKIKMDLVNIRKKHKRRSIKNEVIDTRD